MPHAIRQQSLDIQVDSEAAALALQSSIGDINRQRFLPLIEQVLDEFTVPHRRIRIARLQLDLGEVPFDNFASAAEDALTAALRHALAQALHEALQDTAADDRIQSETTTRLELLEHYLLRGALPFWESGERFSADWLVGELAGDNPTGLVGLISRHARDQRVLERVVMQLGGATLRQLLHLVTPEHAALILAYMIDLHRIHRTEPLLSLRDAALDHLLWILVLSYLLRDAGSQFNRRSFLRRLLEGLADSESLDYVQLVETLRRGLQQMKRHRAPTSSLPAALDELLQELREEGLVFDDDTPVPARTADQASHTASDQTTDMPWKQLERLFMPDGPAADVFSSDRDTEERFLRLLQDHPDVLRDLIRRHGRDARQIGRLVDRLSEAMLVHLLDWLDPEHAALILAYLIDIRNVHRVTPLLALDDRRFDRLVWVLVLSYVIENPGSQFNRKSLVLSLLQGMSQSEGLALPDLIETLVRGLAAIETHLSSATSLPAIIRDLAGEIVFDGGHDMQWPAQTDSFAVVDVAGILNHVLRTGELPSDVRQWENEQATSHRLDELALLPLATLHAIFDAAPIRDPALIARRLAQALPETALHALLLRLLPPAAEADLFRTSLERFAAGATDRRMFYAGIITAMLAGDAIDFERSAMAASRDSTGVVTMLPRLLPNADAAALKTMLTAPGRGDASATPASLRQLALDFLRDANTPGALEGDAERWSAVSDAGLSDALQQALDDDTEGVGDLVRQLALEPQRRERWIRRLQAPALARLSRVIEPERHLALLGAAEILVAAWRQAVPQGTGAASAPTQLWRMLFDFLAAHRGRDRSVEQLVADVLRRAALLGLDFVMRLRAQVNRLATAAGDRRLIAALDRDQARPKAATDTEAVTRLPVPAPDRPSPSPRRTPPSSPLKMKTAFGLTEEDDRARGDPIYIGNAGLVLVSAFLPHLFQQLDLLGIDDRNRPRLRDRDAVSRAVHLLQYLVDGRIDAPEPLLVLNKILCGVPTATPVARAIEMTSEENELCDFLLQSMLANWTVLKGTSVAGLRETFLQREGKLQRVDDGWKLRVQRKTLDVLVDQVPWSISILLAPWMPAPVHVTW